MTRNSAIIETAQWWQSPPGRYLLAWEQLQIDQLVTDVFGFHALQLGLPQLDALRANRMPHRWLANDADLPEDLLQVPLPPVDDSLSTLLPEGERGPALLCHFDELPLPDQSVDLVLMPHTLELARDPHDTLREVERVLVPEGRLVLLGLNPASTWGLRQQVGQWRHRWRGTQPAILPQSRECIGYRRVRDWMRLLGFEVERARFGCWSPPMLSERWLSRCEWMDRLGPKALPVFGAVYALEAVKRVRGMRLVGLHSKRKPLAAASPAVVTQRARCVPMPLPKPPAAAPAAPARRRARARASLAAPAAQTQPQLETTE